MSVLVGSEATDSENHQVLHLRHRHVPDGTRWRRNTTAPQDSVPLFHAGLEAALASAPVRHFGGQALVTLSEVTFAALEVYGLESTSVVTVGDFSYSPTGALQTVAQNHRSHDPLHFVLMFPCGDDGYTWALPCAPRGTRDSPLDIPPILPQAAAATQVNGAHDAGDGEDDNNMQDMPEQDDDAHDGNAGEDEWSSASECECDAHDAQIDDDRTYCAACWRKWARRRRQGEGKHSICYHVLPLPPLATHQLV